MRTRTKKCHQCLNNFDVLYRASIDIKQKWFFYCGKCLTIIKNNNRNYIYGGTWKKVK